MDILFACPEENFLRVCALIDEAARSHPDVILLPETWNTGFFPKEALPTLCDRDGELVREKIGGLANKHKINIVAGSVSNLRNGKVYNTAFVFDREGRCIASYDKTHLFSPMKEDAAYTPGNQLCRFTLDGIPCGLIICYDLRFPELTRALCLQGLDVLFVVSQWPKARISHLRILTAARAIENQVFLACCNACSAAGETVFGGNSAIIDPLGETLALAGETRQILTADCDLGILPNLRSRIPVFRDRRPDLYR